MSATAPSTGSLYNWILNQTSSITACLINHCTIFYTLTLFNCFSHFRFCLLHFTKCKNYKTTVIQTKKNQYNVQLTSYSLNGHPNSFCITFTLRNQKCITFSTLLQKSSINIYWNLSSLIIYATCFISLLQWNSLKIKEFLTLFLNWIAI